MRSTTSWRSARGRRSSQRLRAATTIGTTMMMTLMRPQKRSKRERKEAMTNPRLQVSRKRGTRRTAVREMPLVCQATRRY